ncbi:MAG: hypothetical protein RR640_01700 [Oscillospiraceae bacterium]
MKSFLDMIMEIDSMAKQTVAQGDEYAKQCLLDAEEKRVSLNEQYRKKRYNRIEIYKAQETEYYNEKKKAVIKEKNEFLEKIKQIYSNNQTKWENDIFNNIINH